MKVYYRGEKALRARNISLAYRLEDAEVFVVDGGDGSMLDAATLVAKKGLWQIPIIGFNTGHVGFLSNDLDINNQMTLEAVLQNVGSLPIEERNVLLVRNDEELSFALNDVVLQPKTPGCLFEVDIDLHDIAADGRVFRLGYKGDGVIISTASGSTAYNLSAGGPIVLPELDTITITPICPFSLSARPLVLPGRTILRIDNEASAYLTIDGKATTAGKIVHIRMYKNRVKIVKFNAFIDAIHEKLGWNRSIKK